MRKWLEAIPRLMFPDDGSEENKKDFSTGELLLFYGTIFFLIVVTILFN